MTVNTRDFNFLVWTGSSLIALTIANWVVYDFSWIYFIVSVAVSILQGILAVWLIKFVQCRLHKQTIIKIMPNDSIINEAGTNLFVGKIAIGGKLALTKEKLIFKPHKFNRQVDSVEIQIAEIKNLRVFKSLGFLTNRLAIFSDTNKYDFVLEDPNQWKSQVLNCLNSSDK